MVSSYLNTIVVYEGFHIDWYNRLYSQGPKYGQKKLGPISIHQLSYLATNLQLLLRKRNGERSTRPKANCHELVHNIKIMSTRSIHDLVQPIIQLYTNNIIRVIVAR